VTFVYLKEIAKIRISAHNLNMDDIEILNGQTEYVYYVI